MARWRTCASGCGSYRPGQGRAKAPAQDRFIGLELKDVAVDGMGILVGSISAGAKTATTRRFWFALWSMLLPRWEVCPKRRASTWPPTRSYRSSIMWPTCGIEATNSCPQSWHFRSAGRCSLLVGTFSLPGTLLFYLLAHLRSIVRISTPKQPEYAGKIRLEIFSKWFRISQNCLSIRADYRGQRTCQWRPLI